MLRACASKVGAVFHPLLTLAASASGPSGPKSPSRRRTYDRFRPKADFLELGLAVAEADWVLRQANRDRAGAIADYSAALALDPKDEEAWRDRGIAELDQGRREATIADLTQAIALDPDDAFAFPYRSIAYGSGRDMRRANADDDAAIRLDPRLAKALLLKTP